MNTLFVGDVGTDIVVDCGTDISTSTVRKIRAKKPDGKIVEWSATVHEGTKLMYKVVDGDLDQSGRWDIQAYIEMPGWKGKGTWDTIKVLP